VNVPGHIPWPVHRVAISGYYRDALHTILTEWSLADVADAWCVCEAMDAAKARAQQQAQGAR
jgi:hypothetical protein